MTEVSAVINPIRFSGLATGLDTDNIVKELMNAHRIPLVRLQQQRQLLEWQKEAYREINRLITSFRDAVAPLRLQSTFLAKTSHVNDTSVANVTATSNAMDGTYSIHVIQLARGASLTGKSLKTDEMNVNLNTKLQDLLGSGALPQEIYLNDVKIELGENATVASFVADVNAKSSETGVKVSFDTVTQRFFFTTTRTGKEWTDENGHTRQVKIDFGGNSGDALVFLEKAIGIDPKYLVKLDEGVDPEIYAQLTGQNAVVRYQGSDEIEFTTNNISINGLNIQLKGTGEVTVTVSPDVDAVFNAIKKFVDEYNKLVDEVNKKLREPRYRDYLPLTQEQKDEMSEKEIELWEARAKSGLIRNDSMLTSILSQLRMALYSTVESSALKNLPAIFIETGTYVDPDGNLIDGERGKLAIRNESALRDLIRDNLDEVMKLFTVNDANNQNNVGIGWRLYNLAGAAKSQLEKKAGLVSGPVVDSSTLGERIRDMNERIEQMQRRLVTIEQRYWAQFTALERAIARMNMQSAWLAQTFGGGQ